MTEMNTHGPCGSGTTLDEIPAEWLALKEQVRAMPWKLRSQIEPLLDEALEQAKFRGRVLLVARDALEQMRLELESTRFDLDVTRREREDLKQRLRQA